MKLRRLVHGSIYHFKSINIEMLVIYKGPSILLSSKKEWRLEFSYLATGTPLINPGIKERPHDFTEYLDDINKFNKRPENILRKVEIHDLPLFLHLHKYPKFMELLKEGL